MLCLADRGKSELQFELSFTIIGLVDQKLWSFKVRKIHYHVKKTISDNVYNDVDYD